MKLKIILFVLLSTMILSACYGRGAEKTNTNFSPINDVKLSKEANLAKKFLSEKGYTVISYSSHTSSKYVLTKKMLEDKEDTYEAYKWKLQTVSAGVFIGKSIYNERFIVKNHPLDNWKYGHIKGEGKTYIDVIVVEGNVIGGTSMPVTRDAIVGKPFSLDGKKLSDLHRNK